MTSPRTLVSRGARLAGAAVITVLAGVAIAGCGSSSHKLNRVALERSIARSILAEHHISTKVLCPANVTEHKGGHFKCYAFLEVGRYTVPVTQVDSHGNVRWHSQQPITLLSTVKVEHAIASSIKKQRKVKAKVSCPAQVLQAAGLRFTCVATTRGSKKVAAGRYPFKVTETNSAGNVTYIEG